MTALGSSPIEDPAVWHAADIARDRSWIRRWSVPELADMDRIVAAHRNVGGGWMEAGSLPVTAPSLSARLDQLAGGLEDGPGLYLVRGAPTGRWSEDEAKALTLWMGWRLGAPRGQNADSALISAVRDVGADYRSDTEARGYMSSAELHPHTDGCDVTGLFCLKKAKHGGESRIASSLAIYNRILRDEPALIAPLLRGFPFYVRDADGKGGRLLPAPLPVYFEERGVVSSFYNSKSVEVAALKRDEPLTPVEQRALDRVKALASDPEFCADFLLEPGDLFLFSNWTTFHSRKEFVDHDDPAEKSCLLRLWIHSKVERPLPKWMAASARSGLGPKQKPQT